MSTADNILFHTLLLNPGASLTTTNVVYSGLSNKPTSGHFYQVQNLDIIASATWNTLGTYAPNSGTFDYIRFDLRGITPNQHVLVQPGASSIDLSNFNPFGQHEKYLANPNRPRYSDDPAYRTYTDNFVSNSTLAPAFLTSPYETKRLNLGNLVLLEKTTGQTITTPTGLTRTDSLGTHFISDNSTLGYLYNDFGFTAGLRRYYFDVYVADDANHPLIASNNYTADASTIYAQSAAAILFSNAQTFQSSQAVFDLSFNHGLVETITVDAVVLIGNVDTKTGSNVEVMNLSAALAISRKLELSFGDSVIGLFAEFGKGNYDTFSFIPRYGDVAGDGKVKSAGVGIFMKTLFIQNTFIEASLRVGEVRNDFTLRKDPWAQRPEVHSAESEVTYIGAHFGVGQRFDLLEETYLDAYGKYFFTQANKDKFKTNFGDDITIDSFKSSRIKVGARVNQEIQNQYTQFYFGLAGEHEFNGKVTGSNGADKFAHEVDPTGFSGFAELGVNFNPRENINLSLGAFGWAGKQQGGGGTASFNFSF
jgi:hypothetical protein